MKRIVTAEEMKALDRHTISEMGVPSLVLMERAALKAAEGLLGFLDKREEERILVVCGSGNNGGDGLALARILTLWGFSCEIYLAGNLERMTSEARAELRIAENYELPFVNNPVWDEYTTIVDALFGVGLSRPIGGRLEDVVKAMNRASGKKAALDIPSGISADTGQVLGTAFQSHLTVTFAFLKKGLCLYPGRSYAGRILVADVGIYQDKRELSLPYRCLERTDVKELPLRIPQGNKGTFGKVLVVGGARGMCGAAYLCAAACLRAGAGMVKILTAEENRQPLHTLLPEAMVAAAREEGEYESLLDWCDVLVAGPGMGMEEEGRRRIHWFLSHGSRKKKPMVLDADGLNLLAENPNWNVYLRGRCILTPHIGEMSRLTGVSPGEIKEDPAGTALSFAKETGAVCVLKDAVTVTAGPEGRCYVNLFGNPGMATAGSGDVLSGVLGAVLCMYRGRREPWELDLAAALGVLVHSLAGDLAAKEKGTRGMKAGDLTEYLPQVLKAGEEQARRAWNPGRTNYTEGEDPEWEDLTGSRRS
ncbi:MAG: NAD(P)H-hydrate dehydratase [Eubacteriales bacterium]|nr:NAD(P)H-hydrate dehydratase [Eubacteriales bacterium]